MTATLTSSTRMQYSERTLKRAERALCCSAFTLLLFVTMRLQSVPLGAIAGQNGIKHGYTHTPLLEITVESRLMWLISVGLLRREVDGQGITDSFRLTPLGRQMIEKWEQQGNLLPQPSLWDRITNFLARWLRLSV